MKDECFDVQIDLTRIHRQPPSSASVSGFPSFSYSRRAARRRCGIPHRLIGVGRGEDGVDRDVADVAVGKRSFLFVRQDLDSMKKEEEAKENERGAIALDLSAPRSVETQTAIRAGLIM